MVLAECGVGGVENVNDQVDALIAMGVLCRVLAFTELKFSNSNDRGTVAFSQDKGPFLNPPDSGATVRRQAECGSTALCWWT